MIYKPTPNSRYWMAKWKSRGQVIRRSTRETNKKAAYAAELRMRGDFNKEQEEILKAALRFGCGPEALGYCPECNGLLRLDRAVVAIDGMKVCGDSCREIWDRRCRPVPTVRDFLHREFLPAFDGQKRKTRQYYHYGIVRLLNSDLANLRLDEITSQHAIQFAAHSKGVSASTINCALRTLRHALNLAEEWGKLTRAPRIPLAKGERQRERIVNDIEFAAYIEACSQPWRDIALLIRYEGMRPGEVYPLRWENVLLNHRNGMILIVAGKSKAARRQLPMTPEVYEALCERHREQGKPEAGWIFPSGSASGHIEQGSAKNQHVKAVRILVAAWAAHQEWKKQGSKGDWMKQAAKQAQVEYSFIERHTEAFKNKFDEFEPYCLRHTALTRLAEAGCDPFTLAKIAGHSSITITQRYCHPQAEAIERAFGKLPSSSVAVEITREGSHAGVTGEISVHRTHSRAKPQLVR